MEKILVIEDCAHCRRCTLKGDHPMCWRRDAKWVGEPEQTHSLEHYGEGVAKRLATTNPIFAYWIAKANFGASLA